MRNYNKSQTDQDKIADDNYHMTSTLMTSALKVILLQLLPSLDVSFTERGSHFLKENFKKNLMKNLLTQWWETKKKSKEPIKAF